MKILNCLIILLVSAFLASCAAPMMAMQKSVSETYTTNETDSNKVFTTALRTAAEIGLSVSSSDKSAGTFHARNDTAMGNMIFLNFLLLGDSGGSGLSFTLQTKASTGGGKVNKRFVNTFKKYLPVN